MFSIIPFKGPDGPWGPSWYLALPGLMCELHGLTWELPGLPELLWSVPRSARLISEPEKWADLGG